jgi:hypothetical protein
MQDNYYPIEIKICSKNGWSTPQEAPGIWGKYARNGVTTHWWGDGTGASNHDNIVNYFLGQAAAGNKSTNYVVSDNKITLMVSPDNVAWCSNAGNPTTISIEHQPTLGAEGYKKSGWLLWQLEGRYGKRLTLYRHSDWVGTACPGSIDNNRIRAEADKWATGGYLPPTPPPVVVTPPSPTIRITYSKLTAPVNYTINKDTSLWSFNSSTWGGIKAVKTFKKGEQYIVYGIGDNNTLKAHYGMTQYSFGSADITGSPKATNGVNMADLTIVTSPVQPIPTPPPIQVDPPKVDPDVGAIKTFLTMLRDLITNFLAKFK